MQDKLQRLINLAIQVGLDVLSIEVLNDEWTPSYRVVYHSKSLAGNMPVKEFCRDDLDYKIRMRNWKKEGTIFSENYSTFNDLINKELKRIKETVNGHV